MNDTLRDRVVAALGDAYDIEAELGRGGMGVVYGATDRKLRRTVAIKVLPPELAYRDDVRQRFLREAQTAAQLNHPHIVPIYAVEERDGLVCFVMALVDGESVGARIGRERWLPVSDVTNVLSGVADALAYAHSRGIVHRDIKPDNILVDRHTGRAMVTDFGIARAAEGDARLTVTGIAVGTPAYMSPEQAMGEREIDGRSDVYSLAVVGYQMLCGETPFRATNTPSMLMKHISETPTPLHARRPDLPSALVSTIERAMEKKPADRWPGAAEFRDALRAAATGASIAPSASRAVAAPPSEHAARAPLAPIPEPPPLPAAPVRPPSPPMIPPERLSASWKRPAAVPPAEGGGTGLDGRVREILNPSGRDRGRQRGGRVDASADPRAAARDLARDARDMARDVARDARASARDAIDAANAGWRAGGEGLPAPIPPWMPASWRDARRQARAVERDQARALAGRESLSAFGRLSIPERIRAFRRRTASTAVTVGMLGVINVFTGGFPWVLFPAFFMGIALIQRGASLWADGVRWGDVFGKGAAEKLKEAEAAAARGALTAGAPSSEDYARKLVPDDVLAGPHGSQVRRAASDRMAIHEVLAKLTKADKDMIPDVAPTVDALAERVGSVAQSLHRLDEDVQPEVIEGLKGRISAVKAQPESREREQKEQLLERQLATMTDLLSRRDTLVAQMESASLMLQNMRLDMIALRSAGVQSAIDDVSSATQEARALSRDIAHVLEAAREVR